MNGGTITFKFTGDTKELDQSVNKVKSNVTSKMASIGSTIGKGVVVGIGAATTALAGFSKASVSAFADYEQLTGGIETLFAESEKELKNWEKNWGESYAETVELQGTAAQNVVNNAQLAYKNAGISANNYMNTVMSFSAALRQSIKDDSWEMMDVANMAVNDMADNANKMGTSMESIQTAYAGFAKQNYTMLDNLKLG